MASVALVPQNAMLRPKPWPSSGYGALTCLRNAHRFVAFEVRAYRNTAPPVVPVVWMASDTPAPPALPKKSPIASVLPLRSSASAEPHVEKPESIPDGVSMAASCSHAEPFQSYTSTFDE